MSGLPRILLLAGVFGLLLWYFVVRAPDSPTTYRAKAAPPAAEDDRSQEREPWTPEERAIWRDSVDRRLQR